MEHDTATLAEFVDPECTLEPDLWFVDERSTDVDIALAVCGRCPVIEACRRECEAFERGLTTAIYGIWGGETADMRRHRRQAERRRRKEPVGTLSHIETAIGWPEHDDGRPYTTEEGMGLR